MPMSTSIIDIDIIWKKLRNRFKLFLFIYHFSKYFSIFAYYEFLNENEEFIYESVLFDRLIDYGVEMYYATEMRMACQVS